MNVSKVKKNIRNLKKIREIIEISKFDTLNKLQNAKKINETYFEMAYISKGLIEYSEKKYHIKSVLTKKTKSDKTLWIFATISTSLMATSYSTQEKQIIDGFNKEKDELIAIGEPAINFSKKYNLKTIYLGEDIDIEIGKLPLIISSMHFIGGIERIKFVSNSSLNGAKPINMLPLKELNVRYSPNNKIDKSYKFLPSVAITLESLGKIYIQRLLTGLLREAKFFYLREKLIRHETSIKTVDKKIDRKISDMNKLNRKIETEELILVTQIAKRGGNDE